jgi:hypothetical protein
VLMELFGGITTQLAPILLAEVKMRHYVYMDNDDVARQMAKNHPRMLHDAFIKLLTIDEIKVTFPTLFGNIAIIS